MRLASQGKARLRRQPPALCFCQQSWTYKGVPGMVLWPMGRRPAHLIRAANYSLVCTFTDQSISRSITTNQDVQFQPTGQCYLNLLNCKFGFLVCIKMNQSVTIVGILYKGPPLCLSGMHFQFLPMAALLWFANYSPE